MINNKPKTQNQINKVTNIKAVEEFKEKIRLMTPSIVSFYDNYAVKYDYCVYPAKEIIINSLTGSAIKIEVLPRDLIVIEARVHQKVDVPISQFLPTGCIMPILFNLHTSVRERFKPDLCHFEYLVTRQVFRAHKQNDEVASKITYKGYLDRFYNTDPFDIFYLDYKLFEEILKITRSYITNAYCISNPLADPSVRERINEHTNTGRLGDNPIEVSKLFVYRAFSGIVDRDLRQFFSEIADILFNRFKKEKHLWPILK